MDKDAILFDLNLCFVGLHSVQFEVVMDGVVDPVTAQQVIGVITGVGV